MTHLTKNQLRVLREVVDAGDAGFTPPADAKGLARSLESLRARGLILMRNAMRWRATEEGVRHVRLYAQRQRQGAIAQPPRPPRRPHA